MKTKINSLFFLVAVVFMALSLVGAVGLPVSYAQDKETAKPADIFSGTAGMAGDGPVELNGDTVDYKSDEGKFVASGNVVLRRNNATLFCDQLEFYREKQEAHAIGNVLVTSENGTVWADKAFYNFATKKGEFTNARIMANPFFGRAATISKINDNYYVLSNGYLTTSDYDDPEWRIRSRHIEFYPKDRAIAHNSTMYLGGTPVMYLPKYTQDLRDGRPHFSVTPGYSKRWGAFVLMAYRVYPVYGIETVYHVDYRERKGLASGLDFKYEPGKFGKGIVRTYYMNERTRGANHFWQDSTTPTIEHQRYRVEWRHKVDIDPQTTAIMQYYKLTDAQFLKDYFQKEYRTDQTPPTYFLLTRTMSNLTASLRADVRANRYESIVERLPEANVTLNNQQLGDTGLYVKSANTAVSLVKMDAAPTENANRTVRIDTDNEVSRPFKFSFLEFRPYVGTEQTYYSTPPELRDHDSIRGIFKTGMDVSMKFYRIYNAQVDKWKVKIDRLRHVITPMISYQFQKAPTLPSPKLFPYDSIDGRVQVDKFALGLENKLQTKRDGQVKDIFRSLVSVDFRMKDNRTLTTGTSSMTDTPSSGSFGDVRADTEFYPNEYVTFSSDATYNNDKDHLQTANFDVYLKDNKRVEFAVSRRYTYHDDDIVTSQLSYKFNPKWRTVVYERWNADNGQWQEQQYSFVRDLHSWEMEFSFLDKSHYQDNGSEFWIIFRLKAFPSVGFSGGSSFNKTKAGSQSGN